MHFYNKISKNIYITVSNIMDLTNRLRVAQKIIDLLKQQNSEILHYPPFT